jgi:hypothetical protein
MINDDRLPEELKLAVAQWCERRTKEGATQDQILSELNLFCDAAELDVNIPHSFCSELRTLVFVHHRLALEGLSRWEKQERASVNEDYDDDDEVNERAQLRIDVCYDELERAAHNLALVGLVTRLQHWIAAFAERLGEKDAKDKALKTNLRFLNDKLGEGPVSISFFKDLATIRNSIVHADSKAEWSYNNKKQSIPREYTDGKFETVHLLEEQLREAAQNSINQVKYYDDQLKLREANP